MERFVIAKDLITTVRQFKMKARKIEFTIKEAPKLEDPVKWFKDGVEDLLKFAVRDLQPTDKVGLTFCSTKFKRGSGYLKFHDARDIKTSLVWEMISRIFQSNSEGISTDDFCLGVTSVRMPTGSGSRGRSYTTFNEECNKRRGIVTIINKDNLCLPRALVVAKAFVDKDSEYNHVRRDYGRKQSTRAADLMSASGIMIPTEGAGIPELQLFQQYLSAYQIVVYAYGNKGREVLYEGPSASKKLNLLHHQNHFNVVVSLTSAFCCSYYCEACHIPYDTKNKHRCGGTCPCCQESPACPREEDVLCNKCNRKFRGSKCFKNHTLKICEQVKKCLTCLKTIGVERTHVCGELFCRTCLKHQPQPHYCYIQPDTRTPKVDDVLYVFYDLETRQDQKFGENWLHIPNLCVFQQRCSACFGSVADLCSKCGVRRHILQRDPVATFMSFLMSQRKLFKHVVVIAHNGQAFDHQFILKNVLEETVLKPELIMRGTKIILMKVGNVRFIDSLNYFPMPLSALPKAFGLPAAQFKKGYFPHLFNTLENQNYFGQLPSVEFYDADSMKQEAREEFLRWYEEHKHDRFDMQKDLIEYCISDVKILTEACMKFRALILNECRVCPFIESTTIASTCNLIYRRNFLKPNTIGIIPKGGYRLCDNQSATALKWLTWEEDQRKIIILHAGRGKEISLKGVKVDGYCAEKNQVFEFHGCYFHGHPSCLTSKRNQPLHDDPLDTLDRRYETTVSKSDRLRGFGFEVVEKWQCEFENEMKHDCEMTYLNSHPVLLNIPLNPRDAFFGGRTGNTRTYYKCKPGEKIRYVDVCSLYPWVCKNGKFPIGHPELFIGHEDCSQLNLTDTNGLIKCTVLPPRNLFHPVLPLKQNGKLMFVLCRTCGEELNQGTCTHNKEQRALQGTWVMDEILKALEKGYEIITIHEIWKYQIDQYDKLTSTGGMFTTIMNRFLKMKQQASGWPSQCSSQEEKETYIEDFLQNEGIQLDFAEISKNPGLRCIAKLILNSFWGKFGQRENQPKTSIINRPAEFLEMMSDPAIDVNNVLIVNEYTLVINWQYKAEASETLPTVNVGIAAYTTAQARLKLYSHLEQLNERVLYYDTDSVIFVSRVGEWEPPTGKFIGDMTNELEEFGPDAYISEFICGGPKSYLFKVSPTPENGSDVVCKVKGIKLSYKNSKLLNFDSMKELILSDNDDDSYILLRDEHIRRTAEHQVVTTSETKIFKPTSNKRKFSDHDSYPYGHKKLC